MRTRRLVWVLAWALLALLPVSTLAAPADPPHQAGLVIVHGDGRVITQCVGFTEESISGQELVSRVGLDLHMEATAMGPSVCRLDGEGCSAGSNCFCQCMSSPCIYWSYWQWDGAQWTYAVLGAGSSRVVDGTLEGWVWGQGIVGRDAEVQPPQVTFAEVCTGDNWVMGQDDADGVATQIGVGIAPGLWAVLVAVIPLGVGGWLLWRRRQA